MGLEAIIKGFKKECLIKTWVKILSSFLLDLEESELFKAEEKTKKAEKSELVSGSLLYTEQEWHPVVKNMVLNAS